MSNKRTAFFVLLGVLAAAMFLALWEVKATKAIREDLAASELRRSNLTAEIRQTRSAIDRASRNEAALRKALSDSAGKSTVKAAPTIETPAARRVVRAWGNLYYAQLFRKLGLTMVQIEKFEDAVVAHQLRLHDIQVAAQEEGIAATDPSLHELWSSDYSEFLAAESAALGTQGVQQLMDYDRTAAQRGLVSQIASAVYDLEPLTSNQGAQLAQIFTACTSNVPGGSNIDWGSVLQKAQPILSPNQLAVLKLMQMQNQASQGLSGKVANISISLTSPGTGSKVTP